MPTCICVVVTVAIGVVLIVAIVLMAKSFEVVEYNTIALKKDIYSRKIEKSTVYKPGR